MFECLCQGAPGCDPNATAATPAATVSVHATVAIVAGDFGACHVSGDVCCHEFSQHRSEFFVSLRGH